MAKNYTYPRVDLKTRALNHSVRRAEVLDTTVWFCPIKADRGPTGEITKIHSLDEFLAAYGSLSYEQNKQTALMVYNWLSNGGTIYGYRLYDNTCTKAAAYLHPVGTDVGVETFSLTGASSGIESYDFQLTFENGVFTELKYKLKDTSNFTSVTTLTQDTQNPKKYFMNTTDYVIIKETPLLIADSAKYVGSYYNDLSVEFTKATSKSYNISVLIKSAGGRNVVLEQYFKRTKEKINSTFNESDYISDKFMSKELVDRLFKSDGDALKDSLTAYFKGGSYTTSSQDDLVKTFFNSESYSKILANRLETPIDIILDAGYSRATKKAMISFISNNEAETSALRRDIIGIFDSYELKGYLENPVLADVTSSETVSGVTDEASVGATATNIAIYDQYFTINDITFSDQNIYVTPTYFLSKLLPYNDLQYGLQFPTAGLRRGILSDAIAVNKNPNPAEKQALFEKRINYVEKSSREYAFMCQRTHDGSTEDSYTALSFLNNERVLEKMKKELERLGREYLFEFNDSVTLSNMASVLNKYVTNWISNRTLSKGLVEVAQNPYNEEAVDIFLTVRFTGTIEVITVDITIE